jgi:uncharacterized YigZ family protein
MDRHRSRRARFGADHARALVSTDRYRTIAGPGEGLVREKGSRFIGLAFAIGDEDMFRAHLEGIRKEHHAARHWCHAWVLGDSGDRFRANDDGEPAGTAGRPILQRIQGHDLTYAAVIVVRYFGGVLLGRGGLIKAYGAAAEAALQACTVVEQRVREELHITCSYDRVDSLRNEVISLDGLVLDTLFTDLCRVTVALPAGVCAESVDRWRAQGLTVEAVAH